MGTITSLIQSGADSFTNLWDVVITVPSFKPSTTSSNNYSIRCSGFTAPVGKIATYEKNYKGFSITAPGSDIQLDRQFDLTFRVDASYQLYADLLNWRSAVFDPNGDGEISFGGALSNSTTPAVRSGTIIVRGFTSDSGILLSGVADPAHNQYGQQWTFNQCTCISVRAPKYTRENGRAVEVTAKFLFGDFARAQ
jgi:hypothetical protein